MELLYEIFGLDHEDWTEEILVAINNIDPSKYQDVWSLSEKFVAAEGKDILPHKANSRFVTFIFFILIKKKKSLFVY